MESIAELLKKQAAKNTGKDMVTKISKKKKEKVKKAKPVKAFAPTLRGVEKIGLEEAKMREFLLSIVNLDPVDRKEKLVDFSKEKNAMIYRNDFIQNKIIPLREELLLNFIEEYTSQNDKYLVFYREWENKPEIKVLIDLSKSDNDKDLNEEDMTIYDDIDDDVIKAEATRLNIEFDDDDDIGVITRRVIIARNRLKRIEKLNLDMKKYKEKRAKSIKYIAPVSGRLEYDDDIPFDTERRRKELLLMALPNNDPEREAIAEEIGDIKYEKNAFNNLALFYRIKPELPVKEKIDIIIAREKHNAQLVDPEKKNLVHKIARITQEPSSYYHKMDMAELKEIYDNLESNEIYMDEYVKEKAITKLSKIARKPAHKYSTWAVDDILSELKRLRNNRTIKYNDEMDTAAGYRLTNCIRKQKSFGWIKGRVEEVWISFPKKIVPKYVLGPPYITMKKDDRIWYRPSKLFYVIQCAKPSLRRQEGEILTCVGIDKKEVQFMVGYTIEGYKNDLEAYKTKIHRKKRDDKISYRIFLIQNEKLFKKEKRFLSERNDSKSLAIEEILSENKSNDSITVADNRLAAIFSDVGGVASGEETKFIPPNYLQGSSFIRLVIEGIPGITNDAFFRGVATIIVYLQIPEANIFRKRIRDHFYIPQVIPMLSPSDMFPEVFEDINLSKEYLDIVSSSIDTAIRNTVKSLASAIYVLRHPTERTWVFDDATARMHPSKKLKPSACLNSSDVSNVPYEDIVFYIDPKDGSKYCYDVNVILENARKNIFTLPNKPGQKFSKEFLNRYIVSYYDKDRRTIYRFPAKKIRKRFSKKNFINPETGVAFDKQFVKDFSSGTMQLIKYEKMDHLLSMCENKNDVEHQPPENIVYYTEGKSKYCFPITDILKKIEEDEPVNPYTGNRFSDDFIQKIIAFYSNRPIQEEVKKEIVEEKDELQLELEKGIDDAFLVAPGLWDYIKKDIADMENELVRPDEEESNGDIEVHKKHQKHKKNREEKDEVPLGDVCEYCQKFLNGDDSLKSILHNGDARIVKFCSIKCFEDKDDWAKKSKKKRKKRV